MVFTVDALDSRPVSYSHINTPFKACFFLRNFMAEGYCVKCKAKKEIVDAVEELMKNGRKAIKGKCPTCGTVMFKILGGKAAPKPEPAPEVPPS